MLRSVGSRTVFDKLLSVLDLSKLLSNLTSSTKSSKVSSFADKEKDLSKSIVLVSLGVFFLNNFSVLDEI